MTYIEFFDKEDSENICSCLSYLPKRVVFVGSDGDVMQKSVERYKKLFENRGESVEFMYRATPKRNMPAVLSVLEELVEKYDNCVFDLTGGDEVYIFAVGVIMERHKDKNLQAHKFYLENGKIVDCDMDGTTVYKDAPVLSVRENISIYGGVATSASSFPNRKEASEDIAALWKYCSELGRAWNSRVSFLEELDGAGKKSDSALTVTVPQKRVATQMLDKDRDFLEELKRRGLLTRLEFKNGTVVLTYKNSFVKRCLAKAGNVLELYVCHAAAIAAERDGSPCYNDVKTGVIIDWDGRAKSRNDTENEIDVLMMHGTVPVFVSCKNGFVATDELYKLQAVAERFGGKYAKKAVVTATLDTDSEFGEYFRHRARDMGIVCIDNVREISLKKLSERLSNLWR